MIWTIIGLSAAALTTFSFVPQVIKTAKMKSAKDISLVTILQMSLGVTLWLVYGFARRDPIIILANGVTLIILIIFLAYYWRYR